MEGVSKPLKILLANDDGIHAPGLRALQKELLTLGDVQVVAPLVEQSGVSHRITYLHPILVKEIFDADGTHFGWAVDGSPADCVKLGVLEFCGGKPDLIVSGINSGANVGINVLYSGTVAAAMEGAISGITSIAVSLQQGAMPPDYATTARGAVALIRQLTEATPGRQTLWSINFPETAETPPKGVRISSMGFRRHAETIVKRTDPRGRPYYWSGIDPLKNHAMEPETDVKDLNERYVTVTPLHFDLTEMKLMQEFRGAELSLE
ncbi:5'-nucleotidase SurE [Caulifigura coniformis]|uniref:5'-nucleotidase SurE n=1 Tax=Caulifigura coniformis TaxID=2527983 RepID=A0A517SG62_9PLAN|nr:5'-nucleotidase SurE [Caulifigura coniformis]